MPLQFHQYRRLSSAEKTFLAVVTKEEGFPIAADLLCHLVARHEGRTDDFWLELEKESFGPSLRKRLARLGRAHGLPNIGLLALDFGSL